MGMKIVLLIPVLIILTWKMVLKAKGLKVKMKKESSENNTSQSEEKENEGGQGENQGMDGRTKGTEGVGDNSAQDGNTEDGTNNESTKERGIVELRKARVPVVVMGKQKSAKGAPKQPGIKKEKVLPNRAPQFSGR